MKLVELKALAGKATPGTRNVERDNHAGNENWRTGFSRVFIGDSDEPVVMDEYMNDEDADFIAACSPERISALVQAAEALERRPCECRPPEKPYRKLMPNHDPRSTVAEFATVVPEQIKCWRCAALSALREADLQP